MLCILNSSVEIRTLEGTLKLLWFFSAFLRKILFQLEDIVWTNILEKLNRREKFSGSIIIWHIQEYFQGRHCKWIVKSQDFCQIIQISMMIFQD